jgi:hypothetical protein
MAIQVMLKYLLADFRNPLPQKRKMEFERAYKNNTLTAEMIKDLIDFINRPGGLRKPDILGVIAEGEPGRLELHEVCTLKTRGGTQDELDGKLKQLREQVVPLVMKELISRQTELRITSADPLIHSFTTEASNWVPPRSLRACPLGVSYDSARNVTKVTWACFEPAVNPVTQVLVSPGLLPYHIHEISGPPLDAVLPASVRQDLRRWEGELAKSAGLRPLQLLPEVNPAIQSDLLKMDPNQRKILIFGLAGVLIVVLCVVAGPIVLELLAAGAARLLAAGAPVLETAAPAATSTAVATAGETIMPGAVISGTALITEAPAAVATTEGLYPMAEQYAVSLARAAARAAAQAPPPH